MTKLIMIKKKKINNDDITSCVGYGLLDQQEFLLHASNIYLTSSE